MIGSIGNRLARTWRTLQGYLAFGKRVAVFGDFVVISPDKVRMGDNVAINHGVMIVGRSTIDIGDDVVLSARCMILGAGLDPDTFDKPEIEYLDRPIIIGRRAWIGAGAIVLPGVTIGESAIIGAGSVVTKSVPANEVWAGNPARPVKRKET